MAPRASSSGPTATLTLSIMPGSVTTGVQSVLAGNWIGLLPMWTTAGATYGVPWQVLAAINRIESNDGMNLGPSIAGAIGWMQFMPATWASYGVDANGDGFADPNDPRDAITSAARYLAAAGARSNLA
ncbi:MAG TPA: lytic transglycosylase domain-containing protein, partial [Gaiellaceae bacterium]|nr:lytic transglycosylase domain-containing protein [Gaiellaceae bacterium]